MLPLYEKGSKEYETIFNRIKACCAAQSRQIDKTKIGENVKAEATIWRQYQHIDEEKDTPEEQERKKFLNSILAERKPYFFRYKYNQLDKEYRDYIKNAKDDADIRFGMTLEEVLAIPKNEQTEEQKAFIECYYHFMPVVESDMMQIYASG